MENQGPIHFRYNPTWIKEKGVVELIRKAWMVSVIGSPAYIKESKLKAIKQFEPKWEKEQFYPPGKK